MKILSLALGLSFVSSAFAGPFSPEELLGTYTSSDKKAVVRIYKEIVRERTLFDPEVYEYYADFKFDGGPCMEMYGNEREIIKERRTFGYNGSWLPKHEYLSTGFSEDSDYDGDVYIESAGFTATKEHKNGKSTVKLELDFSVGHNPDYSDGEDGGEGEFERCSKKTVSSWTKFTKRK